MIESIKLIEEILADRISNESKSKLESYLINGPLNTSEKTKLLHIISDILDAK